jgi:hypothetical protein
MTIFFPDVSTFQAGLSLHGAVAAIAKATEGTNITDGSYSNFRSQASNLGIPFAGYHFVNSSDIGQQAAHAHSVIGAAPTMFDAEVSGATVSRLVDLTNQYRALGGNPTLVYLPHWWWQQLGSPDLRPLADLGLSLISSQYTTYSDSGPGWAPYGGMTPAIWQYTDTHSFNGMTVDFNAYKGTVEQLRELFEGGGVSTEDVIIGESQLFDQAANRSTPTGRNFANDFYVVVSAALSDEFSKVNATLAQIQATLATLTGAGVAPAQAAAAAAATAADQAAQLAQADADAALATPDPAAAAQADAARAGENDAATEASRQADLAGGQGSQPPAAGG